MNWADTLSTGWDAIRTHRLRSALTALGILIGIAAVVLTVGLGQGAQQQVSKQLSALGGNLLIVSPGSSTSERRARRLRLGDLAHDGRRDGTELEAGRAEHRRGRARPAELVAVAGERVDELDHDSRRHLAVDG